MWENWVIDASKSDKEYWCFVPVEGFTDDPIYVLGMNLIQGAGQPFDRGKVVGIINEKGQKAADVWYQENQVELRLAFGE